MNGMWGYKVEDTDYKDSRTLVRYLVKTAGMGANLLLNIGPQPNGELPAVSLERLKDMGKWLRANGEDTSQEADCLFRSHRYIRQYSLLAHRAQKSVCLPPEKVDGGDCCRQDTPAEGYV